MTTELEAACERLRRLYAGESYKEVYGVEPTGLGLQMIDEKKVIEDRLSQSDAGDGEITEEWLREIGMQPMVTHSGAFETPDHVLIFNQWEYGWVVCNARPQIKTRRDVLNLLSALNIPVGRNGGSK